MSQQQFENFTASSLYCEKCKAAMPVRERLLLILPDKEIYDYLCTGCASSVGQREITVELWKAQIDAAVNSHTFKPDIDILVLDGIPRNVGQARIMDELIDVKKVFHLSCPNRDALFARLKKRALKDNRLDDANEEVIQRRLALYEMESKPVLGYYGPDRITSIDATEPPAKVLLHILESVNDGVNGAHESAAV